MAGHLFGLLALAYGCSGLACRASGGSACGPIWPKNGLAVAGPYKEGAVRVETLTPQLLEPPPPPLDARWGAAA